MSDNPVQPEARNAAGRTAALLFAIVIFAAIWEADSNRNQLASEIGTPPALSPSSSHKPIEIGNRLPTESPDSTATVELDRTLKRERGLVRIRLQLEPVAPEDGDRQTQLSELVCEGQVEDLRRELLTLLEQLDETSEIVPASATTSKKPETVHRGFIFLSRRPEIATPEPPVAIDSWSPESKESTKPELLDFSIRIGIR
jgi:hypothetical protein